MRNLNSLGTRKVLDFKLFQSIAEKTYWFGCVLIKDVIDTRLKKKAFRFDKNRLDSDNPNDS